MSDICVNFEFRRIAARIAGSEIIIECDDRSIDGGTMGWEADDVDCTMGGFVP